MPKLANFTDWPAISFERQELVPLMATPANSLDPTSLKSRERTRQLDTLVLDPDTEERYFQRVHHITEYEISLPYLYGTDHFSSSRIPLIHACGQGDLNWVRDLLMYTETDPNVRSFLGWTALQQACSAIKGRPDLVVKLLIERGAEVNAPPGQGWYAMTALQAACEAGNDEVVDILLAHGADIHAAPAQIYGKTALQAACEARNEKVVDILLAHGADIHAAPAQINGKTALVAAVLGRSKAMVDKLLRLGADVNQEITRMRQSALEAAVKQGDLELTNILVHAGASINEDGAGGSKALYTAVLYDNYDVAKRLLELGANIGRSDNNRSPMQKVKSLKMLELFMAHGGEVNRPSPSSRADTPLQAAIMNYAPNSVIEELIRLGADIHASATEARGRTALQAAAGRNNVHLVKLLVDKHGANVNEPRALHEGYTALEAACCSFTRDPKRGLEVVGFLLERGAKLTPLTLHVAAAWGHVELAATLLKHGARVDEPTNVKFVENFWGVRQPIGDTAIDTARLNNQTEVLKLLQAWKPSL
jgi:ankyrin repeat protein